MYKFIKEFNVDVPVVLVPFTRFEKFQKVFEVVKKARPSTVFVISDGPRKNNQNDIDNIQKVRELIESIDWDCKLEKIYYEFNQGLYKVVEKSIKIIVEKVDRFIYLEDDAVPHPDFFNIARILLKKYENDERISLICGTNHDGITRNVSNDYFFSKAGSITGFATWKRSLKRLFKYDYHNDEMEKRNIKVSAKKYPDFIQKLEYFPTFGHYKKQEPGLEFFFGLNVFADNQINIILKKNMIKSIGYGVDSANAKDLWIYPKVIRELFDNKVYSLKEPIKHPEYTSENKDYEKRVLRIFRNPNPLIRTKRYFEKRIKYILHLVFMKSKI